MRCCTRNYYVYALRMLRVHTTETDNYNNRLVVRAREPARARAEQRKSYCRKIIVVIFDQPGSCSVRLVFGHTHTSMRARINDDNRRYFVTLMRAGLFVGMRYFVWDANLPRAFFDACAIKLPCLF